MEPNYLQKDHKYNIKISILGPISAGKSSILSRYSNSLFNPNLRTTINIDIITKIISIDEELIRLEIWDSPGDERFNPLTKACFRRTQGFLVVFDLNDKNTFENCQKWVEEIKLQGHPDSVVMLVGNKRDTVHKRTVCKDSAEQFMKANQLFKYMETSALTGKNIDRVFMETIDEIVKRIKDKKLLFPNLEGSMKLKEKYDEMEKIKAGNCCIRSLSERIFLK